MTDRIEKTKEISLIDSEYSEEMIRYNITYNVEISNGMPIKVYFTSIVRTELQEGKNVHRVIKESEMPFFMRKNILFEELEGWAY